MKYGIFWPLLSPDGGVAMNYKKILAVLFALAAFTGAGSAFAQTPYGMPITLEQAKKAMAAAEAEARKNNWNVVIAIVDAGGNLMMLQRFDNTQFGSVKVATEKGAWVRSVPPSNRCLSGSDRPRRGAPATV
jgi:hypothetical protein